MKRAVLILGLCLLAAAPSFAGIRCGTRVVSEGATRSEVAAKCGEPTEVVTQKSVFRRPVVWTRNGPYFVGEDFVEIAVEAWIYNLGPNKLMRQLRFEGGVLVDVDTLGYGYN